MANIELPIGSSAGAMPLPLTSLARRELIVEAAVAPPRRRIVGTFGPASSPNRVLQSIVDVAAGIHTSRGGSLPG